jgi:hypothetical protein
VIYNEFSSESQPLVATTRFQTDDGKIFRLTKNIVVPGSTKVGGETKPGAIEADVIADAPGPSYNIDPATFKIPGFAGGPKFEKFYAKSTESMTGGIEGETPVVTAQDIAGAKDSLLAAAKKEAMSELKSALPDDRKIFDDTVNAEMLDAKPSAAVGTQTDKFTYAVKMKAQAVSFSENDVKISLQREVGSSSVGPSSFDQPISYVLSDSSQASSLLKFEAKTDIGLTSTVDIENFKRGTLGKNMGELDSYIKTYSEIQKADINFWPFFATKVPLNENKVQIETK